MIGLIAIVILIFALRMGVSNFLIKKRDYERILLWVVFYILGILCIGVYTMSLVELSEVISILNAKLSRSNIIAFLLLLVTNTYLYKWSMQYSITRKSNIPSMFLAPRKNYIFTKYAEIVFQQSLFVAVIILLKIGTGLSNLNLAWIMATLMLFLHIPLFFFTDTKNVVTILVGATIGGFIGSLALLSLQNGYLVTLLIHMIFYSSVLASLGKYHRELHLLKKEVLNGQE